MPTPLDTTRMAKALLSEDERPETASAPSLLLNSEDGQQNPLLGNEDVSTSDILRRYGLLSH